MQRILAILVISNAPHECAYWTFVVVIGGDRQLNAAASHSCIVVATVALDWFTMQPELMYDILLVPPPDDDPCCTSSETLSVATVEILLDCVYNAGTESCGDRTHSRNA